MRAGDHPPERNYFVKGTAPVRFDVNSRRGIPAWTNGRKFRILTRVSMGAVSFPGRDRCRSPAPAKRVISGPVDLLHPGRLSLPSSAERAEEG